MNENIRNIDKLTIVCGIVEDTMKEINPAKSISHYRMDWVIENFMDLVSEKYGEMNADEIDFVVEYWEKD